MTREPEWTDHELAKFEALAEYEAGVCSCGFHQSQTKPGVHFYEISEQTCPVCLSTDRYARVQHDADEKADKALGETPPPSAQRRADGRKTFVRQVPRRPSVAE